MSNPAEVAKTRLQLQGELMRNGYSKVYSNTFDAIGKTFRAEGVRGIQRGLTAACAYSVCPTLLLAYFARQILKYRCAARRSSKCLY